MERLSKGLFIKQMNNKLFMVGFFDYEQFSQLRKGFISNTIVSLYEDVYNIDDCFVDKGFLVLFRKADINNNGFEEVRVVDNPSSIYEKNDNDFTEIKADITYLEVEPVFYYVREVMEKVTDEN